MRKLSEIRGEEGIAVVGDALPLIGKMVKKSGKKSGVAGEDLSTVDYIGRILKENPHETLQLMAVIDGVPFEKYKNISLLEVLHSVTDMINDPELMSLFS